MKNKSLLGSIARSLESGIKNISFRENVLIERLFVLIFKIIHQKTNRSTTVRSTAVISSVEKNFSILVFYGIKTRCVAHRESDEQCNSIDGNVV